MSSLTRARVIKNAFASEETQSRAAGAQAVHLERARRIAFEVLSAREEAARIVEQAKARAREVAAEARAHAAEEARAEEVARLAASFLVLRAEEAKSAEKNLDRVIELAVLLAERIVGEAIRVEPSRVAELAATAIQEARGAERIRIDASPDDVAALTEALGAIHQVAEIKAEPALARGSLVVHTDLGRVDARLEPQLRRLAGALREALKSS